jgi:wobble nucleotide-excising tRNase
VSNETATFKVKGVSNTGEVLLGSREVQAIIQGMVNDHEKHIAELEEEKLNMQISITSVRESVGRISSFLENIEPRSHEAVITFNRCMNICAAIEEMDLPEFEGGDV